MTCDNITYVKSAKAFSPGHITGFFEKPDKTLYDDYLLYGSIGSGFSINKGVTTYVEISKNDTKEYEVYINQNLIKNARVSNWVAEYFLNKINHPVHIKIDHYIDIPIGFGLGTSGAAALSLSFALNSALDLGLSGESVGQIAHLSEIYCNTGLGTVLAEYYGGIEIRTKSGAPGIGKVITIPTKDYKAMIFCIGPLYTKNMLSKSLYESNTLCREMIDRLVQTKNVNDFLQMSFTFSNSLNLISNKCDKIIKKLNSIGLQCSIALFGETIFTLTDISNMDKIRSLLLEHDGQLIICDIDSNGAKLMNE